MGWDESDITIVIACDKHFHDVMLFVLILDRMEVMEVMEVLQLDGIFFVCSIHHQSTQLHVMNPNNPRTVVAVTPHL